MDLEKKRVSQTDIVNQDMIQDILRKNDWNLVQPGDENWPAFVEAVQKRYAQNDNKDNRNRLFYAILSEYSNILHAACISDNITKKERAYSQLSLWVHQKLQKHYGERNKDVINSITQEVLIIVYQKADHISNPAAFLGFVTRIIRNKYYEYIRYKHVYKNNLEAMDYIDLGIDEFNYSVIDSRMHIEMEESEIELIMILKNCFPTRASKQLEVLLLLVIEGLTYQEVAQKLGISVSSVYTLFHRAKQNFLAHCLEEFQDSIQRLRKDVYDIYHIERRSD